MSRAKGWPDPIHREFLRLKYAKDRQYHDTNDSLRERARKTVEPDKEFEAGVLHWDAPRGRGP